MTRLYSSTALSHMTFKFLQNAFTIYARYMAHFYVDSNPINTENVMSWTCFSYLSWSLQLIAEHNIAQNTA